MSETPNGLEGLRERVTANVPRMAPTTTAGNVLAALAGRDFDCAVDVAVCDGERLVGLLAVERLLAADPEASVGQLIDGPPPTVVHGADQEDAVREAVRRKGRSVAVTDDRGRFLGLVPPEELIEALEEEHEEDLARLGGFLAGTSLARTASLETVVRRLWHRLPWLALGLAGAMLSTGIVASFEEQLRTEVLLAFFVPAVVYMADAVGTQTETVVIRGMSAGIAMRDVFGRELASGLAIGALLAAVFFGFVLAIWGEPRVAASVSLALFLSASIATLVAMLLPYTLARLGGDPAFGSGPLATVIQDLLSIVVYFALALALVG
jgi:magnesium transporter